jgi:ubiquinone/menaquinone biosynthesis C-methylase UbiE
VLRGTELGSKVLEIGPGPGLTTSILHERGGSLTCLELDDRLATALESRFAGTDIEVVHGDATRMPFPSQHFSGVASFTMLHHVPSEVEQDRLFAEAFRVLKPDGTFIGFDSRGSLRFRAYHLFDTCVPIDPDALPRRLESAGFADVDVRANDRAFKFRARRPASSTGTG